MQLTNLVPLLLAITATAQDEPAQDSPPMVIEARTSGVSPFHLSGLDSSSPCCT